MGHRIVYHPVPDQDAVPIAAQDWGKTRLGQFHGGGFGNVG